MPWSEGRAASACSASPSAPAGCCFAVRADRPQLLPQADSLMQRALKILPRDPGVIRTLALVQLHRGDHARARSNLEWAWRQGEQNWLRALCACYLAYAHARGGEVVEAQRFLARARRLDPRCRLLAKYTALVAEAAAPQRRSDAAAGQEP